MMIIIEGVDQTGKSSLAASLADAYGYRVVHHSAPEAHPIDEYVKPYQRERGPVVFDRGHIGESVWPRFFGRASALGEPARRYIEMFFESRGAVVIYCRRDYEDLRAASISEPTGGRVGEAVARFEDALRKTILPVFRYTHGDNVWAALTAAGDREPVAPNLHRWVGSARPEILLVGEQAGPGQYWGLPFVPYPGTSGHFLLNDIGDLWPRVAITNALSPFGSREPVEVLWESLRRPKVVSLGNVADRLLTEQGLPHGTAYHPQYVRRFLRSEGPGYLRRQIIEATHGL